MLDVKKVLEDNLKIKYFYYQYIDGEINVILRKHDWDRLANYLDKQPHPRAIAFYAYGYYFRIEN